MNTRGIENAIGRLEGARRLNSPTLLRQAEDEARQSLSRARVWMQRARERVPQSADDRFERISEAALRLERALNALSDVS
jgi:hypothetical protein